MKKMEAKGLEYGAAQKSKFAKPKIKIELTKQQINERKAQRKLKREIKFQMILQSQAMNAAEDPVSLSQHSAYSGENKQVSVSQSKKNDSLQ
jgi:O-glycosyl hydrolase